MSKVFPQTRRGRRPRRPGVDTAVLTPQCLRRPGYPLTYLKILAFYNREKEPRSSATRFLPPRPRRYFRAAEIRYLPRFRGKYFFHWLFIWIKKMGQWNFFASANSRKVQCEHHLVAVLFVCGKFVLMWTICQRLKFLLSHFVFARSLRSASNHRAGGGIRYRILQA